MNPASSDYGPPQDQADLDAYAAIAGAAFNSEPKDSVAWMAKAGHENIRLWKRDGEAVAGLLLVPMGQWFGGRSVPMTGIAGVGVPVEHRGGGHAIDMMRACVRDLAANGIPLSSLYPSTARLYRKAGWEIAGHRYVATVKPADIGVHDHELSLRKITPADEPAIAELSNSLAAGFPGYLDRREYIWGRIRAPRDMTTHGFLVERAGNVDGYVYFVQVDAKGYMYDVRVTDICALSPETGRRLLTVLSDHGTLSQELSFSSAPHDPLLNLMPDRPWELKVKDPWMLRITDVPGALEARGWPAGFSAELVLDVTDDVVDANNARWLLEVADGAARVSKTPNGASPDALSMDVRGFAALYSGHLPPAALEQAGLLTGGRAARRLAAAAFAGPAPAMLDMF
jgi:predicted acetyltransferase